MLKQAVDAGCLPFLFDCACLSYLMRRISRPSLGMRNANCRIGAYGEWWGNTYRNPKPCSCLVLWPLPKSFVEKGLASWKDASRDNCSIYHASIYSCCWPSWLVLVFNISAGLWAECQELTVRSSPARFLSELISPFLLPYLVSLTLVWGPQ